LVDEQHDSVQRHLIEQNAKFKDATFLFGCKTTQVHDHQTALPYQGCDRFLPGIHAAKKFVDTVTPIRIRCGIEVYKAMIEIRAAVDIGIG
jgi:hypothetical protein